MRSDVLHSNDRTTVTPNIDELRKEGISFKNTISTKEAIGEVFNKNGYSTYAAVTGSLFTAHGFSRVFDEYEQRELWDNLHNRWLFGEKSDYDGIPIFKSDKLPDDTYSEIFLDNELKEEKWLLSLMINDYQYIFKPRGNYKKLYHKEKSEIKDKKIELKMRKRVEEINPEVIDGYRLDNAVDMELEIIENKLRSVGYLD